MLNTLELWSVQQEEVNLLKHVAARRVASDDVDRSQRITVSHYAHLGEVDLSDRQDSLNEQHDVDDHTQHLEMCDVETS